MFFFNTIRQIFQKQFVLQKPPLDLSLASETPYTNTRNDLGLQSAEKNETKSLQQTKTCKETFTTKPKQNKKRRKKGEKISSVEK